MALRRHLHLTDETHKVTTLELFFDLVFVLALTQVTALLAADLTLRGAVRGFLVLGLMWWAWVGFTWIGNLVRADDGVIRVVLVATMGAMLVQTMAIPVAFEDDADSSINGPLVFAGAYLAVRALHIALFTFVGRDDPGLLTTVLKFCVPTAAGTLTVLAATLTHGWVQIGLWAAAMVLDGALTWALGPANWRLRSPAHFAERYGLIIIIALGESLVAIGVGADGLPLTGPVILAASLALVVLACLWWMYFDVVALVAERRFTATQGDDRVSMARDSYSYLHFPMVAGIVFLALGLKKVLFYVGQASAGATGSAEGGMSVGGLHGLPLIALYGGVVLYLWGHLGFRLRNIGTWNTQRLVLSVVLLVAIPLVGPVPALGQLAMLAVGLLVLVTYETVRFRSFRDEIRHEELGHAHS